jgi:Wax ester synthase-like Acyl-CoA acyltransferase domain
VPRFRQVLPTYPLDLEAPQWVEAADIDISHHVRRAALPRPGDDTALFRWAAEVMGRRLDRDRPLWECWIVDGVTNNRWAIMMKIHHAIADRIAATHILAGLSDNGVGNTYANQIRAAKEPATRLRLPTITLNPINWIAGAWRTSLSLGSAAAQALHGGIEIWGFATSRSHLVAHGTRNQHASLRLCGSVTRRRDEGVRKVRRHHQRRRTGRDHRQFQSHACPPWPPAEGEFRTHAGTCLGSVE